MKRTLPPTFRGPAIASPADPGDWVIAGNDEVRPAAVSAHGIYPSDELIGFLRHLASCKDHEVDHVILVFADWLEEKGDYRAGSLREIVRDLQDVSIDDREFSRDMDWANAVCDEFTHRGHQHGTPEFFSIRDKRNRRTILRCDRRGAALRRFSVVKKDGKWRLVEPQVDLVRHGWWNRGELTLTIEDCCI